MSHYPSCTWKPIAKRSSVPLQKDLLSLHTAVGSGMGTWNYFNTGAGGRGVYSHIIICGIWGTADQGHDGLALQMQDTNLRSAANLNGNWHIISVETADNAVRPIQPWTTKQQNTLVNIMVDANRIDGIPLVLVPDSKVGRRGISYHRQGCDPYRVSGGELWSEAYGKDCPTQARINQIPGLIARARAIVAGGTEGELPTAADVWNAPIKNPDTGLVMTAGDRLLDIEARVAGISVETERRVRAAITQLLGGTAQRVVDLKQAVEDMAAVTGDDEAKILAELDKVRDEVLTAVTPVPTLGG